MTLLTKISQKGEALRGCGACEADWPTPNQEVTHHAAHPRPAYSLN